MASVNLSIHVRVIYLELVLLSHVVFFSFPPKPPIVSWSNFHHVSVRVDHLSPSVRIIFIIDHYCIILFPGKFITLLFSPMPSSCQYRSSQPYLFCGSCDAGSLSHIALLRASILRIILSCWISNPLFLLACAAEHLFANLAYEWIHPR